MSGMTDAIKGVVGDMRARAEDLDGCGGCEDAWAHCLKEFADSIEAALSTQPAPFNASCQACGLPPISAGLPPLKTCQCARLVMHSKPAPSEQVAASVALQRLVDSWAVARTGDSSHPYRITDETASFAWEPEAGSFGAKIAAAICADRAAAPVAPERGCRSIPRRSALESPVACTTTRAFSTSGMLTPGSVSASRSAIGGMRGAWSSRGMQLMPGSSVMSNVTAWPKATGRPLPAPKRMMRPCDYGLWSAVNGLEAQLGTIEAYNRLVEAAARMRQRIDAGDVKPQNPMFAVSVRGELP